MAKHLATEDYPVEAPADPAPASSPVSGSLFITVCEASYNGGEWRPLLFPEMTEEQAQRMADYLSVYTPPENSTFAPKYRNIRIAHCQFTEIPDNYNDTDPLS